VNYPSLPSSPVLRAGAEVFAEGAGAVLTFGIKASSLASSFEAARIFIESLELFSHLANVGDAKSLVIHPASTTHAQLTEEEQRAAGITPDMIRLSIGLEDIDDLLWDLEQALDKAQTQAPRHYLFSPYNRTEPVACQIPLKRNG
jgi:O-acetylhomoserine (thiol)-lyase